MIFIVTHDCGFASVKKPVECGVFCFVFITLQKTFVGNAHLIQNDLIRSVRVCVWDEAETDSSASFSWDTHR